jgi:protein TilB
VDIHPTYVSVIVKSKVLRVVLPVEVLSDKSIARRIAASGYLELVMPKVRPNEDATGLVHVRDLVSRDRHAMEKVMSDYTGAAKNTSIKESRCQKRERLGESLMKAAGVVDSLKIIRNQCSDPKSASSRCDDGDDDDGEDEPPPLM